MPTFNNWSFWTGYSTFYSQTECRGDTRNSDDFAAVSRGILRTGPRNLAKFFAENCLWLCVLHVSARCIPDSVIRVSDEVSSALHDGRPVVALESAIITHGLPYPVNLEYDIPFVVVIFIFLVLRLLLVAYFTKLVECNSVSLFNLISLLSACWGRFRIMAHLLMWCRVTVKLIRL